MKTLFTTILFALISISSSFSQTTDERNRLKYEAEVEEKKMEYINDFIGTLKVDDFQNEIIRQHMVTYFEEIVKINKLGLRDFERKAQIERLDDSHFTDLKAVVTDVQMLKIMDAIKGKWDHGEEKKKKKKKKKNKREKKDKS
jgi:hypothetical protein